MGQIEYILPSIINILVQPSNYSYLRSLIRHSTITINISIWRKTYLWALLYRRCILPNRLFFRYREIYINMYIYIHHIYCHNLLILALFLLTIFVMNNFFRICITGVSIPLVLCELAETCHWSVP